MDSIFINTHIALKYRISSHKKPFPLYCQPILKAKNYRNEPSSYRPALRPARTYSSMRSEHLQKLQKVFYDTELASKLVKYLFAPRNAIDPAEAYRLFRGRDANM